jgi:hypothetical protein
MLGAWRSDGRAWKTEGILHGHIDWRRNVPRRIQLMLSIEPCIDALTECNPGCNDNSYKILIMNQGYTLRRLAHRVLSVGQNSGCRSVI